MSNLAESAEQNEANEALLEVIRSNVRDAANSRINSAIPGQDLQPLENILQKIDEEEDWLVKIVVNAIGLKFKFKVYYSVEMARNFLLQKKAMQGRDIPASFCHDFIREFCNLTAGAIKIWLQGSNTSAKDASGELIVNLPDQKPAAIEPLLKKSKVDNEFSDIWAYRIGEDELICACDVIILDWEKAHALTAAPAKLEEDDDSGQIEFL